MSHSGASATQHPERDPSRPAGTAGRRVSFWFENRRLEGHEGDSIAKALFHNGIKVLSHSVKYGRPRGIHCGRGRCVMCHVEADGVSGVKACSTPVAAGMRIRRQHYNPFYGGLINRFMSLIPFPAGFYYRMFTRPKWVRNTFVATVRRLAGVGRIDHRSPAPHAVPPADASLSALEPRYDVVVVGAGISGMAASLAAARAGARVLLVDENGAPGGLSMGHLADDGRARARDELARAVSGEESITLAVGTTAQAFYHPDRIMLGREGKDATGGCLRTVATGAIVLGTGAQDLIPLFDNNDLPGVFGGRGLRLFVERDGLVPGTRAAVYGSGSDLEETVALLRAHRVKVEPPVDATVAGLVAAEGREWVARAVFETASGNRFSVPCDMLCIAVPGQPAFELAHQAGFRFAFEEPGDAVREELRVMIPVTDLLAEESPARYLVGEASGRRGWRAGIEHATTVGRAAAGLAVGG